jgi:hypothetical protein
MTIEETIKILKYLMPIPCRGDGKSTSHLLQTNALAMAIEALQFALWVATEIFDDNWEYNKDAFAEIACRKLAKLGIVRAKGDEWELTNQQESENEE